jgi:phosphoglycolate phosphatase
MLVVFDLDGTLIDSRADLAASTNDTLVSFGAVPLPEEQVTSFVGEGARVLVARALEAVALPPSQVDKALARFLDIYNTRLLDRTRPYDGVPAVLAHAQAAGAALGVITNKPQSPTDRLLLAFGMASTFQWVIGGDTAFARKPDPASLQWVMDDAGCAPERTLFVGDSPIDAETARAAGAAFCLAAYGFGQVRETTTLRPGEFQASTPLEITRAIDAMVAR